MVQGYRAEGEKTEETWWLLGCIIIKEDQLSTCHIRKILLLYMKQRIGVCR